MLLSNTKADLEDHLMNRAKGLLFRSKVRWYEEGEKSTKYFFSLEKAKYNAKTCFKLIDQNNQEIVEQDKILQEQKRYYEELYSIDQDVKFTLENHDNILVPKEIQEEQEKQITLEELQSAIKGMNNNKTPGQDGIPVDFYKVFWTILKLPFYRMLEQVFEQEQLHDTARRGILNLIPKAEKDTRFIKNLRPITLLNVDYKIIEKCIANKMMPALKEIINKDQRGFMKDRRISVNIRKMLDIMHETEKEDMEAVVMSLDFVKCFDKCSFSILHGSLRYFGFGTIIRKWTEILYQDFTVKIQNNGHFSESINIKKGVHQGGCCSSVYFLVIAEILAISLRKNKDIEGISIADIENILNQFADDMDVFSINSESSIRAIHRELNQFYHQSGFQVSYEKTTLYRIGSLRHSDASLYNIKEYNWSNRDITVLGVTIAHEDIVRKNYDPLKQKAKMTLKAWYNRGLSLLGKVQVINTLVASLFVYKMLVLPTIPTQVIREFEDIIREFLWNGKKAKIALSTLQNPKELGGVSLVNLRNKDTALKATWPCILNKEPEYATLVYKTMRTKHMREDIWRCHLEHEDAANFKTTNTFWKDVLTAWSRFNFYNNFRIDNQIIWYNSSIRIGGSPIMWSDIYQKGLKYVHQLFEDRNFKTEQRMWEQYQINTLRYNSLKVAIPKEWKIFFQQHEKSVYMPLAPHNYDMYKDAESLSGKVYRYINGDILQIQNKYMAWTKELGVDLCQDIWEYGRVHKEIYSLTNVPKYRSFQYRLLQRGLVTNIHLKKWNMLDSENCSFCKKEKETVSHLLWKCPVVQTLWQDVFQHIQQRFGQPQQMNAEDILLNRITMQKNHVVNFMCLITKQYIYRQRCMNKELQFPSLMAEFRRIESIEKYIAIRHGKIGLHQKKWMSHNTDNTRSAQHTPLQDYIEQYIDQNVT